MKKILVIFLICSLLFCCMSTDMFSITASAATSGTTGDCTWLLDGTVLTISGAGAMGTYAYNGGPWGKEVTEVVVEYGVTSIANFAFYDCKFLTSIVIPNSVKRIGGAAFRNCIQLTEIIIPDSVTSIGAGAFDSCYSLTKITLPFIGNTVDGIDDTHFGHIFGAPSDSYNSEYVPSSLKEVVITKAKNIDEHAFFECKNLTSITILDGLTSIGKGAFAYCSSLTSVVIHEGVKSINSSAFAHCSNLTNITIPDGVASIGENVFVGCIQLTEIIIPDSVTSIGKGAFYNCYRLTKITLPFIGNTVDGTDNTHFGYIFGNAQGSDNNEYVPFSLKEVVITKAKNIDKNAFFECENLTSITILDGLTSIGLGAFRDCKNLVFITLPDSVTSVGNLAFYRCSNLTDIIIPESVTSIGEDAFYGCYNCKDVWYRGSEQKKAGISIGPDNDYLTAATWHYNTCKEHAYSGDCDKKCNDCDWRRSAKGNHTYDNNCDSECNTCGYIRNIAHTWQTDYNFDQNVHWQECSVCGSLTNLSNHSYDNAGDVTCNICKHARVLESISITTIPNKLSYLEVKDELDVFGGKITLRYNDGTTGIIDISDEMISGFDNTKVATQTLTVSYGGFSDTYDIVVIGKSLSSIAVTTLPIKTAFLEAKDILEVLGGKITLYYNNGTSHIMDMLPSMVAGFDNTIVGAQTLTVTYNGKSSTYDIEIVSKELASIELIDNGLKKEYLEGKDSLDVTNGTIRLHYNNGTYGDMALTTNMVLGFNNTVLGVQTLTVAYGEFTDTYDVEIIAKTLESIAITALPNKTHYLVGKDSFSTEGGKVTLYYNNGTRDVIDLTSSMVSGFSNQTVGTNTLTVSYEGKTATFSVTIDEKSLTDISVTTRPSKLTYLEGDSFDKTGMIVTAYYNNDTSEIVTNYTVSGYTSTPGTKTITVSYNSKTTSFTVTVQAKSVSAIAVTTKPTKLTYIEETELDDAGMVLTVYYNNDTSETVTTGWVSEYDFSEIGTAAVKVTYGGKSCTYNVTVVAKKLTHITIESKPSKLSYLEGDAVLDTAGLSIRAYYNNDTSEVIVGNYTVTGYSTTPGTKTITVAYNGKTDTFTVTVLAKSLSSIAVTTKPNKLTYTEGEAFNKSGMVVTAFYNNNTSSVVTDYTVSGYTSTPGTKTITVTYGGKIATFTVTVKSGVPQSVTSSKFTISGNKISKISAGTTVSTLLNGISEGSYCKVYNGNSVVSGSSNVGTGMVVKIMDGNTAKASYTVIVTGDTNGDGNITVTDMIAIKAHVLKKSTLSGVYAIAADTNGDSGISITDFIQVKAKILGKGSITAR